MIECIEQLPHDGKSFFLAAFQEALAKRVTADHSDLTMAIRRGVHERMA